MTRFDSTGGTRWAIPAGVVAFLVRLPALLAGLLALAACGGGGPGLGPPPAPEPAPPPRVEVSIPDANLRAAVEARLGKESGATIYVDEMETITDLDAPSREINDLRGLETAERLRSLDLSQNDVSDLSPLSGLTTLRDLFPFGK